MMGVAFIVLLIRDDRVTIARDERGHPLAAGSPQFGAYLAWTLERAGAAARALVLPTDDAGLSTLCELNGIDLEHIGAEIVLLEERAARPDDAPVLADGLAARIAAAASLENGEAP